MQTSISVPNFVFPCSGAPRDPERSCARLIAGRLEAWSRQACTSPTTCSRGAATTPCSTTQHSSRRGSRTSRADADRAIVWRRYILAARATTASSFDGDFVECGAYTGVGVKTVVDYLGGKRFPREVLGLRSVRARAQAMAAPSQCPSTVRDLERRVRDKFANYPQVQHRQGRDPGRLRRTVARRDRLPAHRSEPGAGRDRGAGTRCSIA